MDKPAPGDDVVGVGCDSGGQELGGAHDQPPRHATRYGVPGVRSVSSPGRPTPQRSA